jgi:uncharacterized membrane-anchored protein
MIRLSPTLRLVIAAGIMTLALITMIASKQHTLSTGNAVELETFPVDPAALFRGDDIPLRYAISLLDLDRLPSDGDFETGDIVYVVLKPGEPYWTAERVGRVMPVFRTHHAVIKGRVAYHWRNRSVSGSKGQLDVTYGIEDYAVRKSQRIELKDPSEIGRISMRVAVDNNGNAAIKQVLVDGQPRVTESLF